MVLHQELAFITKFAIAIALHVFVGFATKLEKRIRHAPTSELVDGLRVDEFAWRLDL